MIYIYIGIILIIFEIILRIIFKYSLIMLRRQDVFPPISKDLIDKYLAFDSSLGWTNRKMSIKKELSQGEIISYSYDESGARCLGNIGSLSNVISTWGDSFCQCREVSNTQTWQYFLTKSINSRVSNFGVGNYGVDQALLRLKKEYIHNPTKYVILAFTPYTITRITSVWKHFSEFGNVLAFKPRYLMWKNELKLIPNIIKEKEQLANSENYSSHVIEYDEHYQYIKKHIYTSPLLLSIFFKLTPFLRTITKKIANVFNKLKFKKLSYYFATKYFKEDINYRKDMYRKHSNLLQGIIKDFFLFSKEKNFKPIILLLPALEDVRHHLKMKDDYSSKIKVPEGVELMNFMDVLSKENILENCFIDKLWGGHYGPLGNQKLANFIENKLNEINIKI